MRKIDYIIDQTLNQSQLVEAIKANNDVVLKSLYTNNYYKVESLILKNSGTKEHAKDVFQEAFLITWRNIKDNKFEPKNESSINGYLYSIAKNKWMDYLRSKEFKKTIVSSEIKSYEPVINESEKNNDDNLNQKRLLSVMQSFKNLGLPCKTLLMKFYFEKKSMKTIATELKLNAASTRNKKYRCMQKLRELALKSN